MKLVSGNLPRRKRENPRNAVTAHPLFRQIETEVRNQKLGAGIDRALLFTEADVADFGMKAPWRAAVEALRRIIKADALPYRADKYQTAQGWVVRVRRVEGRRRKTTEAGPAAKSA
jgi:hypothetical protein